ncbi:MAG TPA: type III-A CRISPR-associated RAMP protein Csm3 [Rectinema sp.]|jgi:CRISPR-associated protein Csm3|nr:type III-A CRISPR-associated RAMP protein Csm3 [Rectinema sp.]
MKTQRIRKITGKIKVETGLHIGAPNESIEIGGMDNPIIKDPMTGLPYIPGSSLKGKMRSLMEWKLNKIDGNGNLCNCGREDCPICRVFGAAISNDRNRDANKRGPTRLIVRDAPLSLDFANKADLIIEEKDENSINRIFASAVPRSLERVAPGVTFDLELVYRVIDTGDNGDKDEELFESVVLESLKLLENDYLGGGGSRGNGKICFIDLKDENGAPISLS